MSKHSFVHESRLFSTDRRTLARGPFREFLVTSGASELCRDGGRGYTVADAIRVELAEIKNTAAGGEPTFDDLLIWDGSRVAALIQGREIHRPTVVEFPAPREGAIEPPAPSMLDTWTRFGPGGLPALGPRVPGAEFTTAFRGEALALRGGRGYRLIDAIDSELADLEAAGRRGEAIEEDLAIWGRNRVAALIRAYRDADPEVWVFRGEGEVD